MGLLSKIIGLFTNDPQPEQLHNRWSAPDKQGIANSAQRIVDVDAESLEIAKTTKNQETRQSRIITAKDQPAKIRQMQYEYPFLKFPTLADIESKIRGIESPSVTINAQNDRRDTVFSVHGASDTDAFISGYIFYATLQLRTPLKVISRHGEVYEGSGSPPYIADPCDGFWFQKTKSWRELGIDLDEMPDSVVASDVGPVKPEDYIPFLVAVRSAVESDGSTDDKIKLLREATREKKFSKFVRKHGGQGGIIDYFFPSIWASVPGINNSEGGSRLEPPILF